MDYRLGPRRYSAPLPENGYLPMRVSEDARRCVVFLGWQMSGPADVAPIEPKATGFLMAVDPAQGRGVMLVTARHVAEKLHPPFVIRMNKRGGGSGLVHIERPGDIKWCFHPTDETVDIAVAPFDIPNWADVACYTANYLFADDAERWKHIYVGDDACVIGLFHFHAGDRQNQPIVHCGHIAMLPSEPVIVDGVKSRGFLLQTNAISGCSGSPVFALASVEMTVGGETFIAYHHQVALIGVWSSSWKVNRSEITAVRTDDDDETGRLAPLGMGIVTPAALLAEIVGGDELKRELRELEKRHLSALSATPDSLSPTTGENSQHKEDFTSLLSAAAKKRQPADQT